MTTYKIVNPATGKTEREFPEATDAEIQAAVDRAHQAFGGWRASRLRPADALRRVE